MGLDMYFYLKTKKKVVAVDCQEDGGYDENYVSYATWSAKDGCDDKTTYPKDIRPLADYIFETNFRSQFNDDKGYMYYQVGYFRKFNALHGYIVNKFAGGEDECQEIKITKTKLTKLLGILYQVNADEELAPELLPTQSGCFFGCYEYNDWYFDDVKDAIKMCELFLETIDFKKYDLIYHASW